MAIEIERKFLVNPKELPPLRQGVEMIQGYLSELPSIRFRITGSTLVLAIKEYSKEGQRFELETLAQEISQEEKEKLINLAVSPSIRKVRYPIQVGTLLWEIDVYQDLNLGLITADVELPRIDYPIVFPSWVQSDRDITFDRRYNNLQLGKNPFTHWVNTT